MSAYIDTSLLAAYYAPEPASPRVQAFLVDTPRPAVSWLTEVELCSAVARKVRERSLSESSALEVLALFRRHLAEDYYALLALSSEHYRLAAGWIGRLKLPLRTLDALHLAAAALAKLPLATLDKSLAQSAQKLGLDVIKLA